MKLRKILTSAVATVACVAMLSTNVLAATVTIGAKDGKLTVKTSDSTGQTTFLALNAGTNPADAADSNIQYIDQDTGDLDIAFEKRDIATAANKVDLYVGSDIANAFDPNGCKVISGVYVADTLTPADATKVYTYTYEESASEFNESKAAALLNGTEFKYGAISKTTDEDVSYSSTSEDFDLDVAVDDDNDSIYNVTVTYSDTASYTIPVTVKAPKQATEIKITNAGDPQTYYYDTDASEFTAAKAKELLKDVITVKVTYDDNSTDEDFDASELTYTVGANGLVTVTYGSATATNNTVTVALEKIAPSSVAGTYTASVRISGDAESQMDATAIANYVKDNYADIDFDAKYTLNNGLTKEIPVGDLVFEATAPVAGDNDTATSTVTVKTSETSPVGSKDVGTINVTISYAAKAIIKGSVRAEDKTNQIGNFEDAIPAGAVVMAIPYNSSMMVNYNNADIKTAVVDSTGKFELEVDEDETYTVIISHTKYVIADSTVYVSKTILDGARFDSIQVDAGDERDLGNIVLKYTFFGDLNLDGQLNGRDFPTFKANFNGSILENSAQ